MKRKKCTDHHISFIVKFFCDSEIALRAAIGPQKIRNLQKPGNKNPGEHSTNTGVYTAISLLHADLSVQQVCTQIIWLWVYVLLSLLMSEAVTIINPRSFHFH